ncbi:hypothetical protein OH807_11430 [Kitasatospora sp. NBC_01560]|uniref:hypothetical protein n=1 Tax=Kitasatospora sp. NBC_01560 TaxID=2975965 RepID=UPI003868F88E
MLLVVERSRASMVLDAVVAAMAGAAPVALLVLVFRIRPARRVRVPLAVAWTAAGSLFGWGAWQLVALGTTTEVTDSRRAVPGLLSLVQTGQVMVGLLVLVVGAVALSERAAARKITAVESAGWTRG